MTFVILCIISKLPQKTSLCCNDNKSHSDYPEKHFPIKITSDGRSERGLTPDSKTYLLVRYVQEAPYGLNSF